MIEQKESYRQVMKATSLFGGVQVFNILISVVRSKVIAVLIGPTGMGIATLLSSTMGLVNGLTNFGLDRSAVKDISLAKNKKDEILVFRIISILNRLVLITASFGALLMIVSSPWLSEFAFGSRDYTLSFIWISVALIFKQLTNSKLAILQGLRKLKSLAKANLVANFIGLIVTLPLYYFFKIDAIVPAIIIATLISFFITIYYSGKIEIDKSVISTKEAFIEGKGMIQLGVMLSLSSIIALVVAYVLQIYISEKGGVDEVGLYNAGFVVLNSYVGIIFGAMAKDYFPRLSAISDQISQIRKTVLEQALIAILLLLPIIVIFITFAPFIVTILYSEEFIPIIGLISWGILGMAFKAVSWSMGYIIIAKGDSNVFIKTAIGFNAISLTMNIIGYQMAGLEGLGISFFVYYIFHFLMIKLITYYRYGFYFENWFYRIFLINILLCVFAFLLSYLENPVWKYSTLIGLIILTTLFSFYHLNKKMDLIELFRSVFNKRR
jgi:O-antigen/teichoic acid export membrane protein